MKKFVAPLCGVAALIALSGCYAPRHEAYVDGGVVVAYDGYYDGYYGPYSGGYWGDDGYFYYADGNHAYHRDDAHHFHHEHFDGGQPFHADARHP